MEIDPRLWEESVGVGGGPGCDRHGVRPHLVSPPDSISALGLRPRAAQRHALRKSPLLCF